MPAFEVTETGFSTPRLVEARARVVDVWRSAYGQNAQTDDSSPDGLMINTLALLLALTWEGIGGVWSRSFFQTADGVALDLLLDLFGRRRLAAATSRVDLVYYGDDATVVGLGAVAAATDTLERFATQAAAAIGTGDVCWVLTINTLDDLADYTVTIAAVQHQFTTDASATAEEIAEGLAAALVEGGYDAYGVVDFAGNGLVVLESDGAIAPVVFEGDMTLWNAVRIPARSQNTGPIAAAPGTVTTAVTTISGVEGVVNPEDALPGRLRETDEELRRRHLLALSSSGRATPEAIRARLLDEVEGVTYARVVENESSVPDAEGRPPHSFEAFVLGGAAEDIARVIWETKPAGILAYGDIVTQVLDDLGVSHEIGHSEPTVRYLHLRLTITEGEGYPQTGTPAETARLAVAAYLTGAGAPEMGQDFYRFSVGQPVGQAVPGVASLQVETALTADPGDAPVFANQDRVIADGEILDVDADRIQVLEV